MQLICEGQYVPENYQQIKQAGACEEIRRWNRAGGKVLPGLVNRREAEYKTCMGESK